MSAYVSGDRSAFGELFRRYAPVLLRVLSRQVPPDSARDLLQQTFLHLHRSRLDFRPGASVRPWLFTIAINLKRQYFRKSRREVLVDDPYETAPSEISLPDSATFEYTREVRDALAALPAEQQEVIVLHWMEGLPFQVVAQVVGASLSAVKVRAHRGYLAMRKSLVEKGVARSGAP